ncbi:MAG: polysaccharide deacetylase family protein, partial [Patescibacteria group bacterium]|nr:polysaccharide deacetylase family protein [Patescibacteria group bacterium]
MIWSDYVKRIAGRAAAGLHMALPGLHAGRAGILVYHRTAPCPPGLPEPAWNVSPERLRRQLSGLGRCGFRFIALRQAVDAWEQGHALTPGTVVVTFDDVVESAYRHAWPSLEELGGPATLFLSTAYLDSSEPFPFDEWGNACRDRAPAELYRPIRVEQLRAMLASGLIEIGAHTHTHGNFSGASQAFERDLRTCLDYLERVFGLERPFFAYPFGRIDHGTAAGSLETAARKAGVRCAL